MDRMRMPRINRAAQFAPFDALKGLQEALRVKEFEHDKIEQSELSEEQVKEISEILLNYKVGELLEIVYYDCGYNKTVIGCPKLKIAEGFLELSDEKIMIDSLIKLKKL